MKGDAERLRQEVAQKSAQLEHALRQLAAQAGELTALSAALDASRDGKTPASRESRSLQQRRRVGTAVRRVLARPRSGRRWSFACLLTAPFLWLSRQRAQRRLTASGLFDSDFYLEANPDVSAAGAHPVYHYLTCGASEGRDPHPLFDTSYYLDQNRDVAASGVNPLLHYLVHGAAEGRDPHPMFDTSFYVAQNPDVVAQGVNPLLHFARWGAAEGRRPHPQYSAEDLRRARARQGDVLRLDEPDRAPEPVFFRAAPAVSAPSISPGSSSWRFRPQPFEGETNSSPPRTSPAARTIALAHVLPFPPCAGNEYRIHQLLSWLQSIGHEIHLLLSPLPGDVWAPKMVQRALTQHPNLILCERDGTLRYQSEHAQVRSMLKGLAGLSPAVVPPSVADGAATARRLAGVEQTFCPDYLVDLLLRLEKVLQPDMVIANYIFTSRCLPLLGDRVLKVIDTHDVFSTKRQKVVRFGVSDDLAMTGEEEGVLLRRADLILAIQPEEQGELEAIVSDRRVITAGVDFPLAKGASAPPEEPVILYVASSNGLNTKGARDFLSLAWPLVRRAVPAARLRLVGPICDVVDPGIEGVELLGRVERLEEVYAGARVVINPAVAGTGLKIKTLEALSNLRSIVVWPCGIDGLTPEARRLCHVAQDWYDFARTVIRLLEEDAAAEVVACREELGRQLSPATVYAEFREAMEAHRR
jgi:hypothetical protein